MQPQTIVVPKVDSADDMDWLFDHVYTTVEQTREEADIVDLLTQVESPMGLLNLRYGNFDIIFGPFLAHLSAPSHPTRAMCHALLGARC